MKWGKIKLGDAASFINGYAFKPSDWENDGKEIIRIQNLTGSSKKANYYSGTIADKYLVKKGDILIAWSATLGVFEWEKQDGWLNQHIFKVVFDKAEFDKSFFKYLIEHKLDEMKRSVHGATMKHITKKRFESLQIPLPPLSEQRRLAARLDKADAVRQKSRALVEAYAELGRSVFLEVFGDPVRNERGWEVVELEKLISIQGGYAFKSTEFTQNGIPVVKIGTVNKGFFDTDSLSFLPKDFKKKYEKWVVKPNDLLVSLTGTVGKDDYGNIEVATDEYPSYLLNQRVARLDITDEKINPSFLYHAFKQNGVKNKLTKLSRGVRQANISNKDILSLEIIAPPLPLQTRFAAMVANIEGQRRLAERQLAAAEAVFGGVLQGTFEG